MLMKNIGSNLTIWFLLRQLKVALYCWTQTGTMREGHSMVNRGKRVPEFRFEVDSGTSWRAARGRMAETEGFEPSIRLWSV